MTEEEKIKLHINFERDYAMIVRGIFSDDVWKNLFEALDSSVKKLQELDTYGALDDNFEISVSDLEWVADDFARTMLGESEYTGRVMSVLRRCAPNLNIKLITNEKDPNFADPRCDENVERVCEGGKTKAVKKSNSTLYLPVAKSVNKGIAVTTLGTLASAIHEVGHAVSERNYSNVPQTMAREEFGEIEAVALEKLFMLYLYTAQGKMNEHFTGQKIQPFADGLVGDGKLAKSYFGSILKNVQAQLSRLQIMTDKNGYSMLESGYKYTKRYRARYAVGEIFGTLFLKEYLQNPITAIKNLNNFVSNNSNTKTILEVASMLIPQTLADASEQVKAQGITINDALASKYTSIIRNVACNAKITEDYDELH